MIESNLCDKGTFFYKKKSIRCGTRLLNFETPVVMGILNLSPDSFYAGSRYLNDDVFISEVEKMLEAAK